PAAEALHADPLTRELFPPLLEDEALHITYTRNQLARLSPDKQRLRLWQPRAARLWSAYLRLAARLAAMLRHLLLLLQYFLLLPPFAALAKRAARSEPQGFAAARRPTPLKSQY